MHTPALIPNYRKEMTPPDHLKAYADQELDPQKFLEEYGVMVHLPHNPMQVLALYRNVAAARFEILKSTMSQEDRALAERAINEIEITIGNLLTIIVENARDNDTDPLNFTKLSVEDRNYVGASTLYSLSLIGSLFSTWLPPDHTTRVNHPQNSSLEP